MLTSIDRSHQHEGIITLKMDYTGTTHETAQARKEALQNEMQSRASTPQQSSIRDHTGSGVGNNPDDHKTADPKQGKQSKVGSPLQTCPSRQLHMSRQCLIWAGSASDPVLEERGFFGTYGQARPRDPVLETGGLKCLRVDCSSYVPNLEVLTVCLNPRFSA